MPTITYIVHSLEDIAKMFDALEAAARCGLSRTKKDAACNKAMAYAYTNCANILRATTLVAPQLQVEKL